MVSRFPGNSFENRSGYQSNDTGIIQSILDLRNAILSSTNPGSGNMTFSQDGTILDIAVISNYLSPLIVEVDTGIATIRHGQPLALTPGTYPKVTVDAYGHVTSGAALAAGDLPVHSHDATQIDNLSTAIRTNINGTGEISYNPLTGIFSHANSGVTAGTYTKVTVNARGHITTGGTLTAGDLPEATTADRGALQIANQSQVNAGTANNLAVVPSTLKAYVDAQVPALTPFATQSEVNAGTVSNKAVAPSTLASHLSNRNASTSAAGFIEIATNAEALAGAAANLAITPSSLNHVNTQLASNISTTSPGLVAIATQAEVNAGVVTNKFVSPATLNGLIGNSYQQATEVLRGTAEVATNTETTTGTSDSTMITPLKLAFAFNNIVATNSVKGTIQLATKTEAEAGVDTSKAITPATLKDALAPGMLIKDATELVKGVGQIATQVIVNAGTDDTRFVTPLKLASYLTSRTATETVRGTVEAATSAEAQNPAVTFPLVMTPKTTWEVVNKAMEDVIPMIVALG